MGLDEATCMLLLGITLLSPDRPGLTDKDQVSQCQEKFILHLEKYVKWRFGPTRGQVIGLNHLIPKRKLLSTIFIIMILVYNGDSAIVKLVGKNMSLTVSNVYASHDHNEDYFDNLVDIMLDIQIVHPTLPINLCQVEVFPP